MALVPKIITRVAQSQAEVATKFDEMVAALNLEADEIISFVTSAFGSSLFLLSLVYRGVYAFLSSVGLKPSMTVSAGWIRGLSASAGLSTASSYLVAFLRGGETSLGLTSSMTVPWWYAYPQAALGLSGSVASERDFNRAQTGFLGFGLSFEAEYNGVPIEE